MTIYDAPAVLDNYLNACQVAGVHAIVKIVSDVREEILARRGDIDYEGVSEEGLVGLQVISDGKSAYVSAPLAEPATSVTARATAALARLPRTGMPDPIPQELPRQPTGSAPKSLIESRQSVLEGSIGGPGDHLEVRCVQQARDMHLATTQGTYGCYRTSRASVELRFTHDRGNRVANVVETDHTADAETVLDRFAGSIRETCLRTARLLTAPLHSGPLPELLVFDGHVAAQLLKFLAASFSADAVAQGRSRFAGRLATKVASPLVTIVDDPRAPGLPLAAPFDDEGMPTRRNLLVSAGLLAGLMGNLRYAKEVAGASPGSAWQQFAASPPRPYTRNVLIEPGSHSLAINEPFLRIVQIRGIHTSNHVTGDFSMGATGLVVRNGDVVPTAPLTVAGNVFELLSAVDAVGDVLHWSSSGAGTCGAPDLEVHGLSVGE